ncbi:hypothetical protein [Shewanella sp.]|uniref:hypothetical protein n=1 Tax=Shewanella sp. TaxID=50422 RepID=UPI0025905F9C|nr:hypothetical protein [Shewanella sp.]MCJ8304667.1 hypothetical protein [Shewanella sp.]
MSIPRTRYYFILASMLIFISASAIADTSSSSPVFTAEQQLVLEKYTHGIDSKVGDVSNKLVLLEQQIDADNDAQVIKDSAKQAALDSQLALFKQKSETKNTSLTLTRETLEISQRSVDLWLGFLSLLLAAATFFVWRMRATIQQEWNKQKDQISAEHGAAIQDIDRSKEVLTREVKECLIEARERIKELREELNHARFINGDMKKMRDEAAANLLSSKDNTPEQIAEVYRKNKAKAEQSAQSALVAKAMELEANNDWEGAAVRWLALSDLAPINADYCFNYAYALTEIPNPEIVTLGRICDAYRQTIVINSKHEFAYPNWASTLLKWANMLSGDEKELKLAEAEIVSKTLLDLFPHDAYNLACVKSLQNKIDEAKELLLDAKEHNLLPSLEHLNCDTDLNNLRSFEWFQDFLTEIGESLKKDEAA